MSHADASPSSASIWLKCPASVTQARGKKRLPSPYTREGTAAHEAAENLVHGRKIPPAITVDGEAIEITDEMLDHVQVYARYCQDLQKRSHVFQTETRVELLDLPEAVYGTADAMGWNRDDRELEIADLKYGKGVLVGVDGNPQLKIYGLGGYRKFKSVRRVKLTIIQPRTAGPPVQSVTYSVGELRMWEAEVLEPALQRIADDDATEAPGSHCRWCVRAGECKALANLAQIEARTAFADAPAAIVGGLTNADLSHALDKADLIVAWINLIRAEASQRADAGQSIPNYKLVPKRAIRKWTDDNDALAALNVAGVPLHEVVKVVSVAAVERVLKARRIKVPALDAMVVKESSGSTLVRDTDPREGIDNSPQGHFLPIED